MPEVTRVPVLVLLVLVVLVVLLELVVARDGRGDGIRSVCREARSVPMVAAGLSSSLPWVLRVSCMDMCWVRLVGSDDTAARKEAVLAEDRLSGTSVVSTTRSG